MGLFVCRCVRVEAAEALKASAFLGFTAHLRTQEEC